MLTGEHIWFALPVVALLSQLGGTYKKQYRRIGIPAVMCLVAFLAHGWSWWLLLAFLSVFTVTTLPFTLIGDGIWENWLNVPWIIVWAFLLGFSGFPFVLMAGYGWSLFLFAQILSTLMIVTFCVLSNVRVVSKYFPWKLCEAIAWGMAMYPSLLLLQSVTPPAILGN